MIYVSVDFVGAIWSDVCELFLNAFALFISVMAVLVPKQMLLFCCVVYFCWITLLWCPAGSVDCVCDQFCQDVVTVLMLMLMCCLSSVCFVFMYLFVYVIVKSNGVWV